MVAYSVHLDGVFHNTQRVFFILIASGFAVRWPTLRKWTSIASVSHFNRDFSQKKISIRIWMFSWWNWIKSATFCHMPVTICLLFNPFDRIICYCHWNDKPCDDPNCPKFNAANCSTVKLLLHQSNLSRFQILKCMLATTSTKYV